MAKTRKTTTGNGANLGFEEKLWAAADKLRGHMDADKMQCLTNTLASQFQESAKLEKAIIKNLASRGFSPKEPT